MTEHDLLAKRKSTKNLLDLISNDTTLSKVAGTRGGEYTGPCPWCGGRDRFRVWTDADRPGYWCRQCGRKGDAMQYLRGRHGLTYRDACARLGLTLPDAPRQGSTPKPPPLAGAPNPTWETKARVFIESCEETLWLPAGHRARTYPHQRDLQDETIHEARLGYHAVERWEQPEQWGLPAGHKKVHLLQGIVFPKIPKNERYRPIAGSRATLYGIDALRPSAPAILVEDEPDALSILREAGDSAAVLATGSTGGGRLERWIGRLGLASTVLLSFDADTAGEEAAMWWRRALGERARRWRPYWSDANAMLQGGADLRIWVREGLGTKPAWWRELATWTEVRRELWEERACIMEIEAGLPRDDAERQASEAIKEDSGIGRSPNAHRNLLA